jgi:hypothetical protein
MSVAMYDLTIPVLIRGLGVLKDYLDKAATFAAEKGIDPAVLIDARLAPDMLPFSAQLQRASDNAKGGIGRLTGVAVPSFPDTETGFAELKERIDKTTAFLRSVGPDRFEGSESRPVELTFGGAKTTLRGERYLLVILLPNFFFHIATAHGILRHAGLPIGKADYLGNFD